MDQIWKPEFLRPPSVTAQRFQSLTFQSIIRNIVPPPTVSTSSTATATQAAVADTSVTTNEITELGQYEYKDFDEVMKWVEHFHQKFSSIEVANLLPVWKYYLKNQDLEGWSLWKI